jgi:hypothetical protein
VCVWSKRISVTPSRCAIRAAGCSSTRAATRHDRVGADDASTVTCRRRGRGTAAVAAAATVVAIAVERGAVPPPVAVEAAK